jgi:hypothetical protein
MRGRSGWLKRGLLALIIFASMMFAFYAQKNWGRRGPNFTWTKGIVLSFAVGLVLTAMLDAPDFSRQATISDDSISSFGNAGHHMSLTTIALRDVQWVRLTRPEELGRSFGAMEVASRRGMACLGVPGTVSISRIADVLHGQGIRVLLSGWTPVAQDAAADPNAVAVAASPVTMPVAHARVEKLGATEAGQILTPRRLRFAVGVTLGPLVALMVLAIGLFGFGLYEIKIARAPATLTNLGALFGGIACFIFGVWFTSRFGNLVPSRYLRSVSRSVIELRPGAAFNPRDPEAVYIEVIPRSNWGKAMVRPFSDFGLMKVDPLARAILFEGDQERWRIPATSLISMDVESFWGAGHVEGQEKGEKYFVTVIRANVDGAVWEAPVSKCHVEFRPKNNQLRESNAIAVRDSIRTLLPGARSAVGRS